MSEDVKSIEPLYRSQSTQKKRDRGLEQWLDSSGDNFASAPDEVKNEICQCLDGLLPTLKKEYAEVLERIDLRGEASVQVAESLGLSRNAIDVRLHRARQALKKSVVRTCGTCTKHGCLDCTCRSR